MPRLSGVRLVAAGTSHSLYATERRMTRREIQDRQNAAWLHGIAASVRQAAQTKQDPPPRVFDGGSTAHKSAATESEGRSAQSDTKHRR